MIERGLAGYTPGMAISLALAVLGGIIIFATHGVHLAAFPWLNVYAAGWVMLVIGGITFVISAISAHNSRFFGRWFGGGGE